MSSIVSDQHWAFKKEINIANIIVTFSAILAGFWWVAGLETRVILNDRGISENKISIQESKNERKEINDDTDKKLSDIYDRLGILIADFRYYQGAHDREDAK